MQYERFAEKLGKNEYNSPMEEGNESCIPILGSLASGDCYMTSLCSLSYQNQQLE